MKTSTSLFDTRREVLEEKEAPLAARMRPRTLDEFVGQEHIVGPGRLLRRAIQADQLSSLIFYGPPGTGKTTLARIIAHTTRAHFIAINAVLAGVQDIRNAIEEAQRYRGEYGRRTILFVDEVHRFNKAQQDALLPWVENGTVILIGATTENPYFEVNKPLISRSRIFQLKPLTEDELRRIAGQALQDPERGYGRLKVQVDKEALDHLVNVANGDARALLNALELAVETTPPGPDGVIHVDLAVAEESIQRRAVLYDKEGDAHFDTISAFIKSLRGSDPDAALYWLARMVYAGEDPRFIFRRMLIFASEDVGLADPDAIRVVTACAQAFDYVGLPEGCFHLAEAALYLATAPKSNSVMGFFDALATVEREREAEVPTHLRDASRDAKGFGHGQGYLYPHAYRDHWVAQQYLPAALQGRLFYQPSDQGYEARIRAEVARRREAQLAAMMEGQGLAMPEALTFTGEVLGRARDGWLQRAMGRIEQSLVAVRDRILAGARLQRHHLVLDLNAGSGLLTWEALRRVPEGGVWALVQTAREAEAITEMAERLPGPERPIVLTGELEDLPKLMALRGEDEVRFEAIIGRHALTHLADKVEAMRLLVAWLRPGGRLSLAQLVPRRSQRIYSLLPLEQLDEKLRERVVQAEEAIYERPDDPMVNWDVPELEKSLEAAGLAEVQVEVEKQTSEVPITRQLVGRWFGLRADGRPSYAQHLRQCLTAEEVEVIKGLVEQALVGREVLWHSTVAFVTARRP
ncbi:MAG: AAA family ATPase [Anaerolineae bacterium]|nr:AAA family ATPase [Anaerolineae bacterium]MDW8101128.1 AAA family ATPase [Anaerolineae bacterium]